MYEKLALEFGESNPPPTHRRVHQLDHAAVPAPDNHEMCKPIRKLNYHNGRQGVTAPEQQMIRRNHDLFRSQSELVCYRFERIDRGSIKPGLTGLPKALVADGDVKAFEQSFKRRGPAV